MKSIKQYAQDYVNWVLRLGKVRSAMWGFVFISAFAILLQCCLSFIFTGKVPARDIIRSMIFGLCSAPFVIYFFNLIVEKLERSRSRLETSLAELSQLREADARLNVELEQQAEFLRSFFDASPDLIFYRDGEGHYLGCNRAMEILTGKSKQEICQSTPQELFTPENAKLMIDTELSLIHI